jgi:hypothetical protein
MKWQECRIGMIVRDTRNGVRYKVTGSRGVTADGVATATDCGAWVEEIEESADGVRELWVIHWSYLEEVTD